MKKELAAVRDRLEEEEWARKRLEKKLEEYQSRDEGKEEQRISPAVAAAATSPSESHETTATEREGSTGRGGRKKLKRCVILVASNGRDATASGATAVLNHIPPEARNDYEIEVAVTYRIEEAFDKVNRGLINVRDSLVVVDCLTNNVRDTRSGPALSPDELIWCLDRLRDSLWAASASQIIVCEVKPTQRTDVSPYNCAIDQYLKSRKEIDGGYGCRTQVRMDQLRADGLHLKPQFHSVLNETYACAIIGMPVPYPTPLEDFQPAHVRRRWEREWPVVGGRQNEMRAANAQHGWSW